ncbi:Integrator complex subunit 7 [Cricetulus griseus]|uniref:Integrator complex subunit 7 n=1 Tax=Cricetulus griseus TaxID=10029 RepID=G3I5P2_CRIGR|nr:Integrator complex subunit 7 [Cricetulus griseus]
MSSSCDFSIGLRSGKLGEQCEAVVRFPRLFQKYPFPILINSAFLKLADVFRVGNNFLRLCVLKVTQQSEKHLEKILNVDEFVKRVFSVIHSNDPVARAITLRYCVTVM